MTDNLTKTAPKRIYLCVSDENDSFEEEVFENNSREAPFPAGHDEITWSTDQPVNQTIEYVRADLAPAWKDKPDANRPTLKGEPRMTTLERLLGIPPELWEGELKGMSDAELEELFKSASNDDIEKCKGTQGIDLTIATLTEIRRRYVENLATKVDVPEVSD